MFSLVCWQCTSDFVHFITSSSTILTAVSWSILSARPTCHISVRGLCYRASFLYFGCLLLRRIDLWLWNNTKGCKTLRCFATCAVLFGRDDADMRILWLAAPDAQRLPSLCIYHHHTIVHLAGQETTRLDWGGRSNNIVVCSAYGYLDSRTRRRRSDALRRAHSSLLALFPMTDAQPLLECVFYEL